MRKLLFNAVCKQKASTLTQAKWSTFECIISPYQYTSKKTIIQQRKHSKKSTLSKWLKKKNPSRENSHVTMFLQNLAQTRRTWIHLHFLNQIWKQNILLQIRSKHNFVPMLVDTYYGKNGSIDILFFPPKFVTDI